MSKHGRYGVLLAVSVALLVFGGAYAMASMLDVVTSRMHRTREGADAFEVKDAAAIRPALSAYDRFLGEDAAWRAINAKPVDWHTLAISGGDWRGGPVWHPSARQLATDSAYALERAGNHDGAIWVLRQWTADHPTDAPARADLAALLLEVGRYTDATREYRWLLGVDSLNVDWHWGLARALAWGGHPRESLAELAWLRARSPADTSYRAVLRTARGDIEPSAREAAEWVKEEPAYRPYRLAYAGALVREHRYAEAAPQYAALLRETPDDDSLRLYYAQVLSESSDSPAAIREYSILIAHHPSAALLLARGQLEVWSGDYVHGADDLSRSAALQPSYDAYVLLGDVYRWTGKYKEARAAYDAALQIKPGDPRALLALTDIEKSERMYGAAAGAGERGWTLSSDYSEDNAGFLYVSAGLTRGFALDDRTTISVGGDQRRIAQRYWNRAAQWVDGYEINAALSRVLGAGFTVHAGAGVARHAMVGAMAIGSLGGSWTRRGFSADVGLSRGPVYRTLMSMPTLAPTVRGGFVDDPTRALVGRSLSGSITVPLNRAQVTVGAERLAMSDGNRRTSLDASVRLPITSHVAALYSGGMLGYARRSAVYWDPSRYSQQMVGVEATVSPTKNLELSARVLPGIGRSVEMLAVAESTGTRATLPARSTFQLATSGNLRWHAAPNVAVDASLGYGRGRTGSYQSMSGTLAVRWSW